MLVGSIKVSTRKTQRNAENARVNGMCKRALMKIDVLKKLFFLQFISNDVINGAEVSSHISMAHHWIHHEMTTDQLANHFGLFDPKLVDPASYQVI